MFSLKKGNINLPHLKRQKAAEGYKLDVLHAPASLALEMLVNTNVQIS